MHDKIARVEWNNGGSAIVDVFADSASPQGFERQPFVRESQVEGIGYGGVCGAVERMQIRYIDNAVRFIIQELVDTRSDIRPLLGIERITMQFVNTIEIFVVNKCITGARSAILCIDCFLISWNVWCIIEPSNSVFIEAKHNSGVVMESVAR